MLHWIQGGYKAWFMALDDVMSFRPMRKILFPASTSSLFIWLKKSVFIFLKAETLFMPKFTDKHPFLKQF